MNPLSIFSSYHRINTTEDTTQHVSGILLRPKPIDPKTLPSSKPFQMITAKITERKIVIDCLLPGTYRSPAFTVYFDPKFEEGNPRIVDFFLDLQCLDYPTSERQHYHSFITVDIDEPEFITGSCAFDFYQINGGNLIRCGSVYRSYHDV